MPSTQRKPVPMEQVDSVSLYLNFALYAVLGRLQEADYLLRVRGHDIHRMATMLRNNRPFATTPLHRGILMEDAASFDASGRAFTSWSESEEVATWFADPRSMINEPITMMNPNAQGFMMSVDSSDDLAVLFHYSWAADLDLPRLGRVHPLVGEEGARQIEWSLATQQEVITEPLARWPKRRPYASPADRSVDTRMSPPWTTRIFTDGDEL